MKKRYAGIVVVLMMSALVLPGCANVKDYFTGGTGDAKQPQSQPRYLDFGDVLIPGDMDKDANASYIVNNSHGLLVIKGRVYADSLAQFFVTSMNTDGWALMNQYKYEDKIQIFFKKSERFCSINISENPLATWVEIWVVPQEKI